MLGDLIRQVERMVGKKVERVQNEINDKFRQADNRMANIERRLDEINQHLRNIERMLRK